MNIKRVFGLLTFQSESINEFLSDKSAIHKGKYLLTIGVGLLALTFVLLHDYPDQRGIYLGIDLYFFLLVKLIIYWIGILTFYIIFIFVSKIVDSKLTIEQSTSILGYISFIHYLIFFLIFVIVTFMMEFFHLIIFFEIRDLLFFSFLPVQRTPFNVLWILIPLHILLLSKTYIIISEIPSIKILLKTFVAFFISIVNTGIIFYVMIYLSFFIFFLFSRSLVSD